MNTKFTLSVIVLGVMNIEGNVIPPHFRMPGSIWNIVIKAWIEEVVMCAPTEVYSLSYVPFSTDDAG